MPDFPRIKAEIDYQKTAESVWTYPSRNVTNPEIARIRKIEAHQDPITGTVEFKTTDAYPKVIAIVDTSTMGVVGRPHYVEAYIDLSSLAEGESITVKQYMKIRPDGDFRKYAEETYTGVQPLPLLYVVTKPAVYGLKIEIEMTNPPARDKSFDYQVFIKTVE